MYDVWEFEKGTSFGDFIFNLKIIIIEIWSFNKLGGEKY